MSFTKLKGRIDTLPLVLAGPIVRRVEPGSASVWVALRRARRVRLEVFDASGARVAHGERKTVAVGVNLHIACVTAKPDTPFTAAATYEYELLFDHAGAADSIPSGSGLFTPRVVGASDADARARLTYAASGGPARPSFVLPPPELANVRLLHGSCRKESGPHADALEAADHILRDFFKAGGRRPQMLFLTGDNIYNDGCTRESFTVVLDAAQVLLGWDESMPGVDTRLSQMSERRWGYSLDDAGLSSPGAHFYQLFGLGESLALYLMAFADGLWPDDLDYQRHTFDFRGTLPAIRRALANVATYMIFDDHEFSNSWNLTAHWVELVLSKPMGRRVYQNSLAAYALCQAWGNTPDRFESGAGLALLDAIVEWSTKELAGTTSPAEPLARIERSVGLPDVERFRRVRDWSGFHGPDVVRWDYTVPCPNLNIVVLDAYMWRSYESQTANSFILSEGGLGQQIDQALFPETECSLIVVSNVAIGLHGSGGGELELAELDWGLFTRLVVFLHPVWLLGQLVRLLASLFVSGKFPTLLSLIRAYEYEPEYGSSYENQTEPFELLMARAAHRAPQTAGSTRQARVVFVSGDAHRSCCLRMEYWSRVPFGVSAAPVEGVIAQLLSSPCRWVYPTRFPLKDASVRHWAGWRDEPTLSWTSEPDESPWRFKKSPWMMEYTPGASQPRMNPDPEWRYSLAPVAPVVPAARVPLEIPDRPRPTLDDQFEEMEKVTPDLLWDVEQSHVLKANNLADVSFDWTPAKKAVVQQLWWRGRPSVDPTWTISRYVISMDPARGAAAAAAMSASNTPALLGGLAALLAPFRFAADNEEYLRNLAAAAGWDLDAVVGFDAGAAAADLRVIGQGVETILASLADPPDSLSEFAAALDNADRTFAAVRRLGRIVAGADAAHVDDFAKAVLEALVLTTWFRRSPVSFSIAEILGLVVAPDDGPLLPAIRAGGRLVRTAHRRGALRLDRVGPLLRDPVKALEEEYFPADALATTAGAHRSADRLFPRLARLAHLVGLSARYGFDPAVEVTGGAAVVERLAHMLTLYLAPSDGDMYGATLALSSEERGRRGLLLRPFGTIAFREEVGDWVVRLESSGSIRGLLLAPGGIETSGGESWGLSLAAERTDETEPTVLGGSGGTGITFGAVRIEGGLQLSRTARRAAFDLVIERARVALAASDGDGFLATVLPREGLSADFDFTVGWSDRTGFHVSGSGSMEASWPLHRSIGPVALDSLTIGIATEGAGLRAEASFGAGVVLGPVAVQIDRVGLRATVRFPQDGGNLGVAQLDVGFKPPTGVGLAIDAGVVRGGGFLAFEAARQEYCGVLQLEVADTIAVQAIGLLTTRLPDGGRGFSLVILIAAEGFPPIQLGFGFTLTGVGGLLGVHRTTQVEVLRSGLRTGTLGSILFPADPIRHAPQIVSDLRAVFPPARGRYVFGPMARIAWGTPTLLTVDLALLLELPEPVRLIVLARLQAVLPDARQALIQIRMDAVGVIDFTQGEVALDATLFESRILAFVLTGGMALRARWGREATFVLAVGGFNPRFQPPAGFPAVARLALSLGDGDNPRLRLACYLALTSNTVQFGARFDFAYTAAGFTLAGFLGFDALFQFTPFAFVADVGAMVALKRGRTVLMGVFLDLTLAGPTPWHIRGTATFKVLFFSVTIRFDHRFGREAPAALPPPVDVLGQLVTALGDRRNWTSAVPAGVHARVAVRETAGPGPARVHPLAALSVRQRVVPLNRPVTKLGTVPLGAPTTFTVTAAGPQAPLPLAGTVLRDAFALAQYEEMRDDEKLVRPAFEPQDAGLAFGAGAVAYPDEGVPATALTYETLLIDPTRPPDAAPVPPPYVLPAAVLEAVVSLGAAGQAPFRRRAPGRPRAFGSAA